MTSVPRPVNLRCEHLTDPLGIDEPKPLLSWTLQHPRPGARPSAVRVVVMEGTRVAWESGRMKAGTKPGKSNASFMPRRSATCPRRLLP